MRDGETERNEVSVKPYFRPTTEADLERLEEGFGPKYGKLHYTRGDITLSKPKLGGRKRTKRRRSSRELPEFRPKPKS